QPALCGKLLNSVEGRVGCIHISSFVMGHELGARKTTPDADGSTKLTGFFSMIAKFSHELAITREFLDATIPLIGDINQSIWADSNRTGQLKFSVSGSFAPPLLDKLSRL